MKQTQQLLDDMTTNNNTSSDGTCDINHLNCVSPFLRDPYETNYAVLVPRCAGLLSAISSALIITIILRSCTGITTIYHRIMFGMSAADVISSLAISLTTLPMPRYMPREEEYGFYWAGTRLGNTGTCTAQGFGFTLGMITAFGYNGSLCVYYGCAVALAMKEDKIKKYVEPILHLWPIGAGLLSSIPPLFYGMYNPSNTALSWCAFVSYPEGCGVTANSFKCVRGSGKAAQFLSSGLLVLISIDFGLIAISMSMVIVKAIQTNQIMKLVYHNLHQRSDTATWHQQIEFQRQVMLRQNNHKAIIVHALSYIFAFLITLSVPFLDSAKFTEYHRQVQVHLDKAKLLLMPLQGFVNFFIFISLKLNSYRLTHQETSILAAFVKVLIQSTQEPCYISRISIVDNDRNEDDARHTVHHSAVIDISDYYNEGCEEANHPPDDNNHTKHYLFSMSDESGNSALQYRIKLFSSAFLDGQNESVNVNPDAYHADHAADVTDNKTGDFVDQSDIGSIPRSSLSIKSDETSIYVEETSKPKVTHKPLTASHHPFSNESESSNKSHGISVGESEIVGSVNYSEADEYQSIPRNSYSVKSEGTIKAEEQRMDLIRRLFCY